MCVCTSEYPGSGMCGAGVFSVSRIALLVLFVGKVIVVAHEDAQLFGGQDDGAVAESFKIVLRLICRAVERVNVSLGLPSCSSRAAVLGLYMARSSCQFTLSAQDIAALCTGFSCAALETLVNECILHSDERGAVSEQLVHECITEIRHEDIPRRRPARKDLLDAYRNVGCFVVARTFNDGEYTLCLERDTVCNRYFDDILNNYDDDYHEDGDEYFDEDEDGEEAAQEAEKAYYTKYDCLHALCALLGGYAAEEVLLHKVYDNVSASLWTADKLLLGMSYDGLIGPELRFSGSRDEDLPYARERVQAINAAFDGFMQECYRRAKAIVTANGELIEKLACMLAQQRTMGRQACEEVLSDLGGIRAAEE